MRYRILVTGSRNLRSYSIVDTEITKLVAHARRIGATDIVIVHGDCDTGADRLTRMFCEQNGLQQEPHPAAWRWPDGTFDRSAGPKRNTEMVELGANVCVAFWTGSSTGGTLDAFRKASKAGIRVILVPIKNED